MYSCHAQPMDPQGRSRAPGVSAPQGDALLALWKVERKQLKSIITVVVKCSLEIHQLFGTQESEGLDIRVKIGELWRRKGDRRGHRRGRTSQRDENR